MEYKLPLRPASARAGNHPGIARDSNKTPETLAHSTAVAADTFTLFPKLPTEIRLQIWRHAIFSPAVWTPVRSATGKKRRRGYLHKVTSGFIGHNPSFAGHTCREAREILEKNLVFIPVHHISRSYRGFRITRHPWEETPLYTLPKNTDAGFWVNPDTTVIYLGLGRLEYIHHHFSTDLVPWSRFKYFVTYISDVRGAPRTNWPINTRNPIRDLCSSAHTFFVIDGYSWNSWSKIAETWREKTAKGITEHFLAKCDPAEKYLALSEACDSEPPLCPEPLCPELSFLKEKIMECYMTPAAFNQRQDEERKQAGWLVQAPDPLTSPLAQGYALSPASEQRKDGSRLPKVFFLTDDGGPLYVEPLRDGYGRDIDNEGRVISDHVDYVHDGPEPEEEWLTKTDWEADDDDPEPGRDVWALQSPVGDYVGTYCLRR